MSLANGLYELMEGVIIRLGGDIDDDAGREHEIFDFLYGILDGNVDRIDPYTGIKAEPEEAKEVEKMNGLANSIFKCGDARGEARGEILGVVKYLRRLNSPEVCIADELKKMFEIDDEEARKYMAMV